MFDIDEPSLDEVGLLALIEECARREKAAAAMQLALLGELVRRAFTETSMAMQGTSLPAYSSYGPKVRAEGSAK
jgi:hypothetical protein